MTPEERRRKENADLIERMKRGEQLSLIDQQASWWPPRPIIKKDWEIIRKLAEDKDSK